MQRLIRHGLMFGNLFHVASPALVQRYNRALEHLTGKTTQLTDFHIDISGYSPEVGDELQDHLYLNHAGVNRQFILLSVEQRHSPLLNTKFSTSRSILRQFIDANEAQLFALTARDAVAGELVNSVYDVSTPQKLFDIRRVEVEADTVGGTVRDAEKLGEMVARFKTEPDGWYDDVLIAQMIELAGRTGDVVRNPVRLREMGFDQRNYWTAHFGGLYLFQDLQHPAVIAPGGAGHLGDLPIKYVFDGSQRNQIAKFFEYNDLTETIVEGRRDHAAAILRQKMDFILVDAVADRGVDLTGVTRADMRRLARQYHDMLPEEFHALGALGRERWEMAAHLFGPPGLFLHAQGGGHQGRGTGQHAAGGTGAQGCAADVHLPQGVVLPDLPALARAKEGFRCGFPCGRVSGGQGRRARDALWP